MAAIAGILYPDNFHLSDLMGPMLNSMAHRGPPIQDSYRFKSIQLGMHGGKIAVNSEHTIRVGLDGSLYNTNDLIQQLKEEGIPVTPEMDPALLIVYAYDLWGIEVLKRLDGDYGLFIWDQDRRELIIARDRLGKKPLYWFHDHHHFIFSSELKGLLATGAVPQALAADAISAYLYFGYLPQDMTPILNVNKLLPGHYLKLHMYGAKSIEAYWSYSSLFTENITEGPKEAATHLADLLGQSVRERLPVSDHVGCSISGGLGSAGIAYLLSRNLPPNNLSAYTVGFTGENEEDFKAAKSVADTLHVSHRTDAITPYNILDEFVKVTWLLDEPIADPHVMSTWRLSRLASTYTGTLFSGMGSDEFLAGHTKYLIPDKGASVEDWFWNLVRPFLRRFIIPMMKHIHKPTAYSLLRHYPAQSWQAKFLRTHAVMDTRVIAEATPALTYRFDPDVFLHKFYHLSRLKSEVNMLTYFDVKTRLPDCFMLQYDRLTAAHKLRWETPLLDQRVVSYLSGIASRAIENAEDTAYLLKMILKDVYPPRIVERPKVPRKEFLRDWADEYPIRKVFSLLPKGSLVRNGIISRQWLQKILNRPLDQENSFTTLWAILSLEVWYRLYIERPVSSQPADVSVESLLSDEHKL